MRTFEKPKFECINCKKLFTVKIPEEKCRCRYCNAELRLVSYNKNWVKNIGVITLSGIIGYSIAEGPEIFNSSNDIIHMYELMNACMRHSIDYTRQRNICACTFSKTYESFKFHKSIEELFIENVNKCAE